MKIGRDPYNTIFRSEVYGNIIKIPEQKQVAFGNYVFDRDISIHEWDFDKRTDRKRLDTVHVHTETVNMR